MNCGLIDEKMDGRSLSFLYDDRNGKAFGKDRLCVSSLVCNSSPNGVFKFIQKRF